MNKPIKASSRDIIDMTTLIPRVSCREVSKEAISELIGSLERAVIFYSLYTSNGEENLSNKCKKALAILFTREYNGSIEDRFKPWLREIMFKTHPKPKDDEQSELFEALKLNEGEN